MLGAGILMQESGLGLMEDKNMKILHVASHWGVYRGGAVQLSRIAMEQKKRGNKVGIVFPDKYLKNPYKRYKDVGSWNFLRKYGIKIQPIRFSASGGHKRLVQHILKEKYDIIHAHRNEALLSTTRSLMKYDIPIIAQRGTITKPDKPHLIAGFRSKNVKAIVTVANAVKKMMTQVIGKDKKNIIHTVYGSVDTKLFAPRNPDMKILDKLNLPENAKIIGSLSSYRKTKKIDNILYSLKELIKEDPLIYGVFLGSKLHKKIIPLAKKLGIMTKCRFLGHQSNIIPYISIFNLNIVAANDQEGLSGVLRESLSMGIPSISTDCAGNNEIIVNKQTGLLIPVDDINALTNAIQWSFSNKKASMEMAERGRKWVLDNCTPDVQVNRLDKIYSQAVN